MKMKLTLSMLAAISMAGFSPYVLSETTMNHTNQHMTQKATTDAEINSMVISKISANNSLNNTALNATTENGVVTLTGSVNSENQISTATEIAQSVPGVHDVDSAKVEVTNGTPGYQQSFADTLITAKIKGMFIQKQLFTDKDIAVMSIVVDTQNGVVTLSGTAENQAQIDNAINIAKSIKGVREVKATVTIK